jgi:hypothetical protein
MTTRQFALFLSGLILPALYQRIKFALNRSLFHQTRLRDKSGLNIHHGHWGFLLALLSTWMLVFGFHNYISIGLAGFGWGLMLDEIMPMLSMPSPGRNLELDVYRKSRNATIILISLVVVLSVIIFLAFR